MKISEEETTICIFNAPDQESAISIGKEVCNQLNKSLALIHMYGEMYSLVDKKNHEGILDVQ